MRPTDSYKTPQDGWQGQNNDPTCWPQCDNVIRDTSAGWGKAFKIKMINVLLLLSGNTQQLLAAPVLITRHSETADTHGTWCGQSRRVNTPDAATPPLAETRLSNREGDQQVPTDGGGHQLVHAERGYKTSHKVRRWWELADKIGQLKPSTHFKN